MIRDVRTQNIFIVKNFGFVEVTLSEVLHEYSAYSSIYTLQYVTVMATETQIMTNRRFSYFFSYLQIRLVKM